MIDVVGLLSGHTCQVSCFDIVDAGSNYILVSADIQGGVILWDLDSRNSLYKMTLPEMLKDDIPLSIIHVISDENILFHIQTKLGRLLHYKLITNSDASLCFQGEESVGSHTFLRGSVLSSNHRKLCIMPSTKPDSAVDVFDIETFKHVVENISSSLKTGACLCARLTFLQDRLFLIAGYDNGSVSIFCLIKDSFEEIKNIQLFAETVLEIECVPKETCIEIVCGGAASQVKKLTFKPSYNKEWDAIHVDLECEGISSLEIVGNCIFLGTWDARILVLSLDSLGILGTLPTIHSDTINCMKYLRFERKIQSSVRPGLKYADLLITASRDGTMAMWHIQTNRIEN